MVRNSLPSRPVRAVFSCPSQNQDQESVCLVHQLPAWLPGLDFGVAWNKAINWAAGEGPPSTSALSWA